MALTVVTPETRSRQQTNSRTHRAPEDTDPPAYSHIECAADRYPKTPSKFCIVHGRRTKLIDDKVVCPGAKFSSK